MGQRNFKKSLNSTVSVKYFTVAWPDLKTRIWVFYTMSTHNEHFKNQKYGTEPV